VAESTGGEAGGERCVLSIAVVTYNSGRTIRACLDSLLTHLPADIGTHFIVFDNGSSDDTAAEIENCRQRYPRVVFLKNASNLGYGRAHNLALQRVSSRYHLICNPDIIIARDVFSTLIDFMEHHPGVGIVCPLFRHTDGRLQTINHRRPTVLDLLLRRFLPDQLAPLFRKRLDAYEMRDKGYESSYDVPFLTGAFMFCRTAVLRAVGGFDPRFFLYFEDVDLSRTVQAAGFRTVFLPEVEVTHAWERMAHRSWRMAWIFSTGAFRYFQKWGWSLW
jgi:hypothetical protein